jgi:hypothetical protein
LFYLSHQIISRIWSQRLKFKSQFSIYCFWNVKKYNLVSILGDKDSKIFVDI